MQRAPAPGGETQSTPGDVSRLHLKNPKSLPGLLNAACEALGTVPSGQGMNAPRALPYVVERDE